MSESTIVANICSHLNIDMNKISISGINTHKELLYRCLEQFNIKDKDYYINLYEISLKSIRNGLNMIYLFTFDDTICNILLKENNFKNIISKISPKYGYTSFNNDGYIHTIDIDTNKKVLIKPGRYFMSLLNQYCKITDSKLEDLPFNYSSIIEKITNRLKSTIVNLKFTILDDIENVFDEGYLYHQSGSTLIKSCLNNKNKRHFKLYKHLPVRCLVLLDDNNLIHARALLWEANTDNGKVNFMDKVYYTKDSQYEQFVKWAVDNNYHYKVSNTSKHPETIVSPDGKSNIIKMWVSAKKIPNYFPYLDTFKFTSNLKDYYNVLCDEVEIKVNGKAVAEFDNYFSNRINEENSRFTLSIGINGVNLCLINYLKNNKYDYLKQVCQKYEFSNVSDTFILIDNNNNKIVIK